MAQSPRVPRLPPVMWPDGKYRNWNQIDLNERSKILDLLHKNTSTETILRKYPRVTVGTLAAVRAQLGRPYHRK